MSRAAGVTHFAELNDVLERLLDGVTNALGANLVGAYLVGSFALGDADLQSDCDFLIATAEPIMPAQEAALRRLHRELPSEAGHWNRHLEGSYPPIEDLRQLSALGRPWLFIANALAEMEWSDHCNSLEHRWILRHHGVVLAGPAPAEFADIPADLLRDKMRRDIPSFMSDLATWIRIDGIAWAQRYAVTTLCRMLFTLETGTVTSKHKAHVWATDALDPQWRHLITRADEERARGWDPADLPDPANLEQTHAFAAYATRVASANT